MRLRLSIGAEYSRLAEGKMNRIVNIRLHLSGGIIFFAGIERRDGKIRVYRIGKYSHPRLTKVLNNYDYLSYGDFVFDTTKRKSKD